MPEKKRNAFFQKFKNKYSKWVTGNRQSSSAPGSSHGSTASANNQATAPQLQVTAVSSSQGGSESEVNPPPSSPRSQHLPTPPEVLQNKALSTSNLQIPGTIKPQRPSSSGSTTQKSISTDAAPRIAPSAFEQALQKCIDGLSEDDKTAFKSGEDVMRKIQLLNKQGSKVRLRSSLSARVQKVLACIGQFMGSIKISIQHNPEISALVLGGVNCVLSLVLGYFEFFERLTEMMERIGEHLTYLSNYGREVFLRSQEVQKALVKTYCDLMEFFVIVRHFFLKFDKDQSSYRRGFNMFLKITWEPFEMKFKPIEERFSHHALIVVRTANALDLVEKYEAHAKRSDKEKDHNRRDVLKWLSPDDYDETHERHWTKRYENTGEWLTDDVRFTAWRDTEKSQLVWCYGAPGAGKTVLASLVVEHLLRMYELSYNTGVTYLYCNYKEPREPVTYIRLAIKQLCRRMEHLPDELLTLYKTHFRNHSKPNLRELQHLFVKIIDYFDSTVFLVLDALDECHVDQRRVLMEFLKGSIKSTQEKQTSGDDKNATVLKVFVTSRREEDIRCAISNSAFPTIEIKANRVNADIKIYVTQELNRRLSDGSLVLQDPSLNHEIRKALIGKADGMFLWVDFQLKAICDQVSDYGIKSMLESLPEDMEETYERIINMINQKKKPQSVLASRVLMWIAYAERPLRVEEMVFAVAIEQDTKDVKTLTSMLSQTETVLAACTNLVIVDGNGFLRFVHFSVQEFLFSGRSNSVRHLGILGWELSHLDMAQRCIMFLVLYLTHFKKSHYGHSILFEDSPDKLPRFFRYALSSWHYHCRTLPAHFLLTNEIFTLISSLFEHGPLLSISENSEDRDRWGPVLVTVENYRNSVYSPTTLALIFGLPSLATRFSMNRPHAIGRPHAHYVNEDWAIHFAVVQDSQLAVRHLCEAGYPIKTRNAPPLAYVRSVGVAQLLVENGADVNTQGGTYGNALQAAVYRGNREVVELLLQKGADVNARGGYYGNVLYAAVYLENWKVVELLLQKGADVNAQGGKYGNALYAAVYRGARAVVELLLQKGANVNAQGGEYGNALYAAVYRSDREVVELLLQKGADVNAQGGKYGNALYAAVYRSDREVVELLLQKGADVNAQGGKYGNALQTAVYLENREVVELLLQKGADVNAQGGYYGNALQTAVYRGNREVVELLLQKGADVNAQGGYYGNALQTAVYLENREVVELLLQKGADVNAQGGEYGNALQAAAYQGDRELLGLLLQKGADVNAQGGEHGNALYAAVYLENWEVVGLLLQKGADVNARGGKYGNTLQAMLFRGNRERVRFQMHPCEEYGNTLQAAGSHRGNRKAYGNALQAAAYQGDREVLELIVRKGADVNAQGGEYGNTLQAAMFSPVFSSMTNRKVVELLLEKGADVNAQVGYYGNALQTAVFRGNREVVELLLQKGADVNAQGGKYRNALYAAVYRGDREVVELLLQKGADANAQGGKYRNALYAAVYRGDREVVELLLQKGADVNAQGGTYGNALQAAVYRGNWEVVELLLQKGADVNAQGGKYGNAVQTAVYRGNREVVELLLQKGADFNAQGGEYGNALQAAVYRGNREVVELLLQKGADVNAQGGTYGNALQAAVYRGNREVVELLLQKGADVNAHGGHYGNALRAAAAMGAMDVTKVLAERGACVELEDPEILVTTPVNEDFEGWYSPKS